MKPTTSVHRIHFEDFDGRQFERLVFAYHVRAEDWQTLEWYGQVGSDLGRDIWGSRTRTRPQSICIQCANRKILPASKAIRDIDKVVTSADGRPDAFRLICAGPVSAKLRDKIKAHAKVKGISDCDVWSGAEFEEKLRKSSESLLKRFVEGEIFPDAANDLKQFAKNLQDLDDHAILALMARVFDRPAFHTPFRDESSLPRFKQAITDTIEALNTGIWQTTDGKEIGRLPTRHDLKDTKRKAVLTAIERQLALLRRRFEELIERREIKPCGCEQPDCPVYLLSPLAISEMDRLRSEILFRFQQIHPEFSVRVGMA